METQWRRYGLRKILTLPICVLNKKTDKQKKEYEEFDKRRGSTDIELRFAEYSLEC